MAGFTVTTSGGIRTVETGAGGTLPAVSLYKNVAQTPYEVTTSTVDAGVGINQAIVDVNAAGGGVVFVPAGTYTCLTSVSLLGGVQLLGAGRAMTTLDFSNVATAGDGNRYGIRAQGYVGPSAVSTTPLTYLSADAFREEGQVQVTTTAGINVGDMVLLACDAFRGTLQTTLAGGDTSVVVAQAAGTANPSAVGVIRIASELIAYSSWDTSTNPGFVTFHVRTATGTTGRGLFSAFFSAAAAHTSGVTVFEHSDAKAHRKAGSATQDKGEWHTVDAIAGTVVYFAEGLNDGYLAANQASVRQSAGLIVGAGAQDLTVKMPAWAAAADAPNVGCLFSYCREFAARNLRVLNGTGYGIRAVMSAHGSIAGNLIDCGAAPANATSVPYGIACEAATQWVTVTGNVVKRGMYSCAQLNSGNGNWGVPRYIDFTGNVQENSYQKESIAHPAFQVEGVGEHINFTGNTADGAAIGFFIHGRYVNVTGNTVRNWSKQAVSVEQGWQLHGITIANNTVGRRSRGAGITTLTADVLVGDTTITVASTAFYFSGNAGTSRGGVLAVIQNTAGARTLLEIVTYTGTTATTFTGCTRGTNGTTAGGPTSATFSHSDATLQVISYNLGTSSPMPVRVDATDAIWPERPEQVTTTLATALATGDTSIVLASAAGLPTVGMVQIESQTLTGLQESYATEVVSYTGISGSTLTGCVRGVNGTVIPGLSGTAVSGSANSHDVGVLVAAYVPAVRNVLVVGNTIEQDLDYRSIVVQGYGPAENVQVLDNAITFTNPSCVPATYGIYAELPGTVVQGNAVRGYAHGVQVWGYESVVADNLVELAVQQTSNSVGVGLQANRQRATGNRTRRVNQAVSVASGAAGCIVDRNTLGANTQASAISDSGTGTLVGVNVYEPTTGPIGVLYPPTDAGASQTATAIHGGTGAPNNTNGANGDIYVRSDGGAGTTIYQRRTGTWTGIV